VQELTSQLDTFFEELRQRQAEAAAVVDAIPEASPLEIDEQERTALDFPAEEPAENSEPPAPRDLIASTKRRSRRRGCCGRSIAAGRWSKECRRWCADW
jgi:hypothetical protein